MKRIFSLSLTCLAFVAALSWTTGCTHTPGTYTMQPESAEEIRAGLGNVGVAFGPYNAEHKFRIPAKGVTGGAGRGLVVGAALPVVAGAASPIPFGSIIGLLFVPITAPVGMVYGAVKAAPAEEVEKAEEAINQAVVKLRAFDADRVLSDEIVRLGLERKGLKFVALGRLGSEMLEHVIAYDQLDMPRINTLLELDVEEAGLWGLYTIDPPSVAAVKVRVRLIRKRDNEILLEDTVICIGEERSYNEWAANEGQRFYDEMISCIPRLAEKIVDDFFLVYPLSGK